MFSAEPSSLVAFAFCVVVVSNDIRCSSAVTPSPLLMLSDVTIRVLEFGGDDISTTPFFFSFSAIILRSIRCLLLSKASI